jgi:hypothetical protein
MAAAVAALCRSTISLIGTTASRCELAASLIAKRADSSAKDWPEAT